MGINVKDLKNRVSKDLKKQVNNLDGKSTDKRFLNYYDMKEGQKTRLLLLPSPAGDMWYKYGMHGPRLSTKEHRVNVKPVLCPRIAGTGQCPVCQKGFDLYEEAKKYDKESSEYKNIRKEAARWMPDEKILMSGVVLSSPIEVNQADDSNEIKLINMPKGAFDVITNAIKQEQIDDEDISETPFNLVKGVNSGGYPSYDSSFFDLKNGLSDDEIEYLGDEETVTKQFDFEDLDFIPERHDEEGMQAWLENAEEEDQKSGTKSNKSSSDEKEDSTKTRRSSLKDRMSGGSSSSKTESGDQDEEDGEGEEDNSSVDSKEDNTKASSGLSLAERIAARRRNAQ